MVIEIVKAGHALRDQAFEINREYLESFEIVVREDATAFGGYFAERAGFWLALDDARPVGCIGLRPLPSVSPDACEVKRLYVRPTHRGQHLADGLLDALEQFAREAGYTEAYLDTKDDLVAAIRFYARRGYEPCERYNDNPQATKFMRRRL